MEAINAVNDDLRGQKTTGILIGYILTLALMFVAFEYTQRDVAVQEEERIYDMVMEEDMIPITQQQEVMAPPPAAAPKVIDPIINIVDNNTDLPEKEVETTEEINQAIVSTPGTGAVSTAVATGPVGPVVEEAVEIILFDVEHQYVSDGRGEPEEAVLSDEVLNTRLIDRIYISGAHVEHGCLLALWLLYLRTVVTHQSLVLQPNHHQLNRRVLTWTEDIGEPRVVVNEVYSAIMHKFVEELALGLDVYTVDLVEGQFTRLLYLGEK